MEGLSGLPNRKDTDREILLRLPDKDLIQTCRLNKYLFTNVCDDNFFKRKLQLTYPHLLRFYSEKEYINYKNFYLKIVFYIAKLQEDFNYSYVSGNPKVPYEIFKEASIEIVRNNKKHFQVNYQRLLSLAAEKGELDLVKEAVKNGANIHVDEEEASIHVDEEDALKLASWNGHLEVMKYLVSLGADIHINSEAPLKLASGKGYLEIVKYLVNLGADIHANDDEAFRWAYGSKNLELVKYLESLP